MSKDSAVGNGGRERIRGKPRQRWEKDMTDVFGVVTAAGRIAGERHRFQKKIWAVRPEEQIEGSSRHVSDVIPRPLA